jgi:hypothetical protein
MRTIKIAVPIKKSTSWVMTLEIGSTSLGKYIFVTIDWFEISELLVSDRAPAKNCQNSSPTYTKIG